MARGRDGDGLYAIARPSGPVPSTGRKRHPKLLAMAPEDAEVRQADGQWLRLPVKAVAVGSTVRIRPENACRWMGW